MLPAGRASWFAHRWPLTMRAPRRHGHRARRAPSWARRGCCTTGAPPRATCWSRRPLCQRRPSFNRTARAYPRRHPPQRQRPTPIRAPKSRAPGAMQPTKTHSWSPRTRLSAELGTRLGSRRRRCSPPRCSGCACASMDSTGSAPHRPHPRRFPTGWCPPRRLSMDRALWRAGPGPLLLVTRPAPTAAFPTADRAAPAPHTSDLLKDTSGRPAAPPKTCPTRRPTAGGCKRRCRRRRCW